MSYVSVFDILKIGVGPSSSHTLGPWRASRLFINELITNKCLPQTSKIVVKLYGSLALTGKGHGTDIAVILGLYNADPETVPISFVKEYPIQVEMQHELLLNETHPVAFDPKECIEFHSDEQLPRHPNAMEILAFCNDEMVLKKTYFSVGGGFVLDLCEFSTVTSISEEAPVPFPFTSADELETHCNHTGLPICSIAKQNEEYLYNEEFVSNRLQTIYNEMIDCIYRGCHTEGELPGGLHVRRRAHDIYMQLSNKNISNHLVDWKCFLHQIKPDFPHMLKWISCFAMAVNEENANFSRVVTAPTNGAAGVIPAVLAYYVFFSGENPSAKQIEDFLLTAGVIGGLYKNGATISAAMGGCQAEIGVSSSMAAVALTQQLGGSVQQALQAGEIAMEHHLGLTCDPIQGLVQIPCIERNTMGAIKAITAAHLALASNPVHAKVSLDNVIKTMWETAQDMNHKYKETSLGGLATNISVIVPEC